MTCCPINWVAGFKTIYAVSIPLFRTYILGPAPQLMDSLPPNGGFFCLVSIYWIATLTLAMTNGVFVSGARGIRNTMDTGLRRYDEGGIALPALWAAAGMTRVGV